MWRKFLLLFRLSVLFLAVDLHACQALHVVVFYSFRLFIVVPSSPRSFGKAENTLVRVDRRYVVACVNGSSRVGNQMVPHVTECLHLGGMVAAVQATKAYRGRKENLCGKGEAAGLLAKARALWLLLIQVAVRSLCNLGDIQGGV